jgi:transcription initiation factor TFIIIB Brf1 subunit/transcription initiation factor TFIIB
LTIREIDGSNYGLGDPNLSCVEKCGNPYAYFNPITRTCVCSGEQEANILYSPDGLSRQRRNDGIIPNDPTRHDRGIGVYKIDTSRDGLGKKLTGSRRINALRIRKNSKKTRRSERSEITSRQELKNLAVSLGVEGNTALLSTASKILGEAIKQRLVKSSNRKYFAAAALYKAGVTHGVNISIAEIAKYYEHDFAREKLWDALMKLKRAGILERIIPDASKRVTQVKTASKRALFEIGNKLKVDQKVIVAALKLLDKIDRVVKVQGRSSYAVAATTLFLTSRFYGLESDKLIQKNIASVANIVDATIRKTYTRMFKDTMIIVYVGKKMPNPAFSISGIHSIPSHMHTDIPGYLQKPLEDESKATA